MTIRHEPAGYSLDGITIDRYTLVNATGATATILTYGGTLTSLRVPDRNGVLDDVVLGFDTLVPYLDEHPYFGSLIGRYANRIARGRFNLNGRTYTLACNNGPNHLHGGPNGFHRRIWSVRDTASANDSRLELTYLSGDGEEGYPGNLTVTVVYTLTDQNELRIEYTASTDQDTMINLTNHAYFNLAGGGDILDHRLELAASHFLPVDATLIPLGELRPVRETPMDFTVATPIGARINADDEQIGRAKGYDHTWVLDKEVGTLGLAARLSDLVSGRVMEVYTTEPGIQFYSGNLLDGSLTGKGGERYVKHRGLCLETQHYPDSPNQPQFPTTVLRPGETYQQTTIYRFSI